MTLPKEAIEYRTEAIELRKEYEQEAEEISKLDNTSNEWFDRIDKNRKLFFRALVKEYKFLDFLNEEQLEKFNEKRMGKTRSLNANFNFHPNVENWNRKNYLQVLTSMTGASKERIIHLRDTRLKDKTETEAYRIMFNNFPLNLDRPIVALDLEAASPKLRDMYGQFDFGPRTEIIEVGYVKIWPDGKIKKYSKLFGVDENLLKTNGTGREDVHNISVDEIKNLTRFVDDLEAQKEIYNDLKDCVFVAHNSRYELNQLTHSLRGFAKLKKDNRITILDTMHVSQCYMPENENNTNEVFVTNTGGKYENAHRAYSDALMSLNALFRLKGIKEIEI